MSNFAEEAHLLPVSISASKSKRHLKMICCIRSKAACLILLWNFAVLLVYVLFNVKGTFEAKSYNRTSFITVGISIIAVFAPMAGLLTDLKYSRYKTVVCSSYFLLIEVVFIFMTLIVISCLIIVKGRNIIVEIEHDGVILQVCFFHPFWNYACYIISILD